MKILVILIVISFATLLGCTTNSNMTENVIITTEPNSYTEGIQCINVAIATEFNSYTEGIQCINVLWKNNGEIVVIYGDNFELEKFNETINSWLVINNTDFNSVFRAIGYTLSPGSTAEHTYDVVLFDDYLTEGLYRIKVTNTFYEVTAEFDVIRN